MLLIDGSSDAGPKSSATRSRGDPLRTAAPMLERDRSAWHAQGPPATLTRSLGPRTPPKKCSPSDRRIRMLNLALRIRLAHVDDADRDPRPFAFEELFSQP